MSKITKRFLLILIVLIGAILAIPKLEKAGLYDDYFDNSVTVLSSNFKNSGREKWYCLEKNVSNFGYGEKAVVFLFEYDEDRKQYKITYDMGSGETVLSSSNVNHKTLQKIAYLAMKDGGENAIYNATDLTPYNKCTQVALWYTLQQLGNNGSGLGEYFGNRNNEDSEEHQLRIRDQSLGHAGESAYNIVCTGSTVVGKVDSNGAYQLYREARDSFRNNNQIISPTYKKILMAIYKSGNYQNVICVNFNVPDKPDKPDEPDKPEVPEAPQPVITKFNGSINGMAWVDGQMGDKAVGKPNDRYDINEYKVYDVEARVTATVQELKEVHRYINTYHVQIGNTDPKYDWVSDPGGKHVYEYNKDKGYKVMVDAGEPKYDYITTYENESSSEEYENSYRKI